jgi:nucleoside phosphorylase
LEKETPTETETRNPPRPPGARLLEAVQWLKAEEERAGRIWEDYVDRALLALNGPWERPPAEMDRLRDWLEEGPEVEHPVDGRRRPGVPRVFYGPIGSANRLLKNPRKRNGLRDRFGVKAVEMEASGIADAAWSGERGYLVVRGTCDYCNPDKGDAWQHYAAIVAAAYTRAVVEMTSSTE